MVGVGETPHQADFLEAIKKLESINEEKLMTIAEYLKPEVFKRGLEKGIEIAKAMLLKGINIETVAGITKLSQKEIKKLLS